MNAPRTSMTILLADDDLDDCRLAVEALQESHLANDMRVVHDGEELLDYLFQRGDYSIPDTAPRPGVILLDLNMPRMDGREALAHIKANSDLRHIPVVVLTTSKSDADIYRSYDIGASSFITKPVTFNAMVDVLQALGRYWFEIVQLPPKPDGQPMVPSLTVAPETIVFDKARRLQVMRIQGILPLPVGSEIELAEPNVTATVLSVRLLAANEHSSAALCLDVAVPATYWGEEEPLDLLEQDIAQQIEGFTGL